MAEAISLIDFADSFTYNIAAEFFRWGEKVQVIPWREAPALLEALLQEKGPQRKMIVYGPGPGSPGDYSSLFPFIRDIFSREHLIQVGICLGHQMLWEIRGIPCKRSAHPLHGQNVLFPVPSWKDFFQESWVGKKILVQRYNSLALDLSPGQRRGPGEDFVFGEDGECLAGRFPRGLTFQFHPESIGTSFPKVFFDPLIKFLYNEGDGKDFFTDGRNL